MHMQSVWTIVFLLSNMQICDVLVAVVVVVALKLPIPIWKATRGLNGSWSYTEYPAHLFAYE